MEKSMRGQRDRRRKQRDEEQPDKMDELKMKDEDEEF